MLNIRKVSHTDSEEINGISKLADEIWRQHFITMISPGQIDYMLEKFQSQEAITKQMKEEGYEYYMAYEDGELVGYIGIVPKTDERAIFLSKLYVKKPFRGKGISKSLILEALSDYPENRYPRLYLTCNKKNEGSIQAYLKMGFSITDSIVTPIGNGMVMDDYVLTRMR